jgi:exosome complex component RRP45
VTTPLPERKFDGVFQIFTEFSPMASPAFEIGRYVMRDLEAFDDL